MKTIGERIAELRKERGMTQEEFGSQIGVTAQTISKWENSNTSPDISLLPVLADAFGITIDSLFSIDKTADAPADHVGWEEVPDYLYRKYFDLYFKVWNPDGHMKNGNGATVTPDGVLAYFDEHPEAQSGFRSLEYGSIAYFNREIGFVWRGTPDDPVRLLNDEAVFDCLRELTEPAALAALRFFAEVQPKTFARYTAASFAKHAGLDADKAAEALEFCRKHELLLPEEIDAGEDEPLTVWTVANQEKVKFLLIPILALAKRFAEFRNHWWCLRG